MVFLVGRGLPSKKYPMNGVFELDQAKALREIGVDVCYLGIDLRSVRRIRKFGIEKKRINNLKCYVINVPIGALGDIIRNGFGKIAFSILYNYVVDEIGRPDLIHAHFYNVAECVEPTCERQGIPLMITEHSSNINGKTEKEAERLKKIYTNRTVKKIVAVGHGLKNDIMRLCSVESEVIGNIVDLSAFSRIRKKDKHCPYRFIASGSLIERKGYDVLIKAIKNIIDQSYNVHLDICGEGESRRELERLITDYHLNNNVSFRGMISRKDMADLFYESDCFVLASRNETFGVVYIEAMSCGLPVIATKCGGPEFFITNDTGICVDIDNIGMLSDALKSMVDNHHMYDPKTIRRYVQDNFSPDFIAKIILEEYSSISNHYENGM